MKTVIIVSKCLATFPDNTARFHFKGVAAGDKVNDVMLSYDVNSPLTAGIDYIMYVTLSGIINGQLRGHIVKRKPVSEQWGNSPKPMAPDSAFTITTLDKVAEALHEGKKLQCEEWGDEEWIRLDDHENLVDENGRVMYASVLIMNRIFNWRITE